MPGRTILSVALEAVGAGNLDDVVVRYDGHPDEFTQVRFAVDLTTPLDTDYLFAKSSEAGTSMLQKFHKTWLELGRDAELRMQLVTNRAPAHDDPLLARVDGVSGLLVPAITRGGPRTAIGKQRLKWAQHLGIEEDELIAMLSCIRFRLGRQYDVEFEHAGDLMLSAGMRNDANAVRLGTDLVGRWIVEGKGRRELSAPELQDGIDALGLHVRDAGATVLIQAIDHVENADDADEVLDWVAFYEAKEPQARRRVVTPNGYRVMQDQLRSATNRLMIAGHRHVVVRGPMRLPAWFAAGAALPETRGVRLTCGHIGQPWSTDDAEVPVTLDASTVDIGNGPELAVALAFAADPVDDIVAFARNSGLPINRILRLGLPGDRRISCGGEAVAISRQIKEEVRRALRETDAKQVHVFQAGPAGLALLLGHQWNRIAPTLLWEDLGIDGYEEAFEIPS